MSRICVKNLPKYVAEDRLRDFFSQKGEVTDAKLMRTRDGKSRQFAFIGYRTDDEAQNAIKYFHKSFLDTSRIVCEVACKDGDPNIPHSRVPAKDKKLTDESNKISSAAAKKVKKSVSKKLANDDPELQEFIQVTQPRIESKIWADDVLPSTNNKKHREGSHHSEPRKQEGTISRPFADGSVKSEEDNVYEERQVKVPNVTRDEVDDMDYFRSKVKKDWSDPDDESSDDDEDVIGFEQDNEDNDNDEVNNDEDDAEGDQHGKGVDKHSKIPEDTKHEVITSEEGVSSDYGGEFMNSGNITSNSPDHDEVVLTGRLFVRNLSYVSTEDELLEHFRKFGNVLEVHLVIDKETKRSKGYAYVRYKDPKEATRALQELDHSPFQGRLLHIMPAKEKESPQSQEAVISDHKPNTLKQRREEEKKSSEANGNTQAWNSLFMRSDTIVENMARKYKVSKSDLLDREADDLAVRLALGETQIIAETKEALTNAGVNVASLEEFASGKTEALERSNHVILVKNLPYSSTESELSKMFGRFGSVDKIIFPPTRTLALVIFLEPAEARAAFRGLAYKRFMDAPLYLEWAPRNILNHDLAPNGHSKITVVGQGKGNKVSLEQEDLRISDAENDPDRVESRSVYVKNLNFKSTAESLRKHISENMKEGKITSVKIQQHVKKGKNVSTGFGFVEFDSVETAANICRDLQGTTFDGHALIMELCHAKKSEKISNKSENDRSATKIIVRNVAFEATEKELRQLFSPFGQVKSLRLPTRFGKHRGFAFVEFVTKQEAQNALKALSSTHLYGRHLVLERAKEGETLEELRARTAAQFANDEDGFQNPAKISKKRKLNTPSF